MCLCWLSNTDALGSLEQEYRLVSCSTFTTALEYRRHADDKVKFSTFNSVDFWTFRLVVTQSVDVVGPVWTCLNNALQSAAMTEFVVVLSSSRQTRSCFSELCCKSPRSKACHCKVCNYTLWQDACYSSRPMSCIRALKAYWPWAYFQNLHGNSSLKVRAYPKYFLPFSARYSVIADGRRSCRSFTQHTIF